VCVCVKLSALLSLCARERACVYAHVLVVVVVVVIGVYASPVSLTNTKRSRTMYFLIS